MENSKCETSHSDGGRSNTWTCEKFKNDADARHAEPLGYINNDQSEESDGEPNDKRHEHDNSLETVEKSIGQVFAFQTVSLGFDSDAGKEIARNVINIQGV